MKISAIICTHNPRPEHLQRTLDGLREQTLDCTDWELWIIDNRSQKPIAETFDISWHPHGRIIREDNLGIMHARLRGIRESRGDILCYIDDDNALDPEYLAQALIIGSDLPHIGCWSGEIAGEFETPPPDWFFPHQSMLVIRPMTREAVWGNSYHYDDALPCGAGMCLRRTVAMGYLENFHQSELRAMLGRNGASLASGDDVDMAFAAIDMGLGVGRYKAMKLRHLIPKERLEIGYLERLAEGIWESYVYIHALREQTIHQIPRCPKPELKMLRPFKAIKYGREEARIRAARKRGIRKGLDMLKMLQLKIP